MSERELPEETRRTYHPPYTDKRKIPTISKYREEVEARQQRARAFEDRRATVDEEHQASPAKARIGVHDDDHAAEGASQDGGEGGDEPQDTSEAAGTTDPRQRMKERRSKRDDAAEREVTDPVTHLPVQIRDYTNEVLEQVPENQEHYGSTTRTATGVSNKSKSNEELQDELHHLRKERAAMQALFPPPDFDAIKEELLDVKKLGATVEIVGVALVVALLYSVDRLLGSGILQKYPAFDRTGSVMPVVLPVTLVAIGIGAIVALIWAVRDWVSKRVDDAWDDEIWAANARSQQNGGGQRDTESVAWLNSLLAAVWPLVNPELFTSLADTLEDVMQASLPRFVRMVSVDDIGQGSESIQILGVKWLPTGAAARSVTEAGDLKGRGDKHHQDEDGQDASEANEKKQHSKEDDYQEDGTQQPVAQGLEAEEGDFVNIEVAFAYRARSKNKSMKERSKDSHIYLAFYLPGNLKVPVWVELRGVVGAMRMRLQLCPDPPFFSLCTLTFLGQPKVSMSCVPVSRYAVNIMDVPLISNFVQSSVDAAMAEYVAPKSLNLDLKDMLAGDDFKKDTAAHGVLVANIKRGAEFKMGDAGIPLIKEGSSDPYVSVGWAKFGKPVWSTRLLMNEMEPYWDETCYVLVTQQELDVEERIRVQLWDSDRISSDDDLGRIEVSLKELMKDEKSRGKMWDRFDGFRALKAGENMPGKLEWSVGYFPKTRIHSCQLEQQSFDPEIRTLDQLQKKVDDVCDRKLREARVKQGRHSDDDSELQQQRSRELKEREDAMIISAPPPDDYPSGIFSIQIHQITGLELAKHNKDDAGKDAEASDEEEAGDGLPSAYCNIIINHKKVFKTRTKPTNAKPFYNAGTERYIADWRQAEVHVSVRDARVKEEDPLLGIVHLPLAEVFRERSQVNGFFPLVGGVGYGRVRISMVWRSIQLQPSPQARGWDYGTLEIQPKISNESVPEELQKLKLKFRGPLGRAKLHPSSSRSSQDEAGDANAWTRKRKPERPLKLGVRLRHSSCVSIAFEDKSFFGDKIPGFAVLWLKDIPDEQKTTVTLPVFKGDFQRATNCCLPESEAGEKLGEITLTLTFWAGLGAAHSKWAKKDRNVRNVVEVLGVARDNLEEVKNEQQAGIVEDGSDGDDDGDSDSEGSDNDGDHASTNEESENEGNGGVGVLDPAGIKKSASEFKRKQEFLGRRHRGIMQWRGPRTFKWAVNKVEDAEGKFLGMFKHGTHGNGGQGVETEV